MLAKGEVLQNRYRIIRRLGHGGMGAVYEAKDERLGSSVALKEIIIEIDRIPAQHQRGLLQRAFEREAKLLAGLHHEVFPRVMDYFSEENRQFLIMEIVVGDDLGEFLQNNKTPFAPDKALPWADQLLDALDYLHTRTPPIFHRDIKPQNLKVTSREKIKLLDFGIAKVVDQTGSTMTNLTFVGATFDYAPIEQVLPATPTAFREFIVLKHSAKASAILSQNTDARCDIYAVGATFYHLLTNRLPIDSAQRSLQLWEGNKDPLPKPNELNEEIPTTVSEWILKAMEIERENRFSSALEMQKALKTAIVEAKAKNKPTEIIVAPHEPKLVSDDAKKFSQEPVAQKLTESEQSQIETEKKNIFDTKAAATNVLWLLPILAVGLLAVGLLAVGGMIWLNSTNFSKISETSDPAANSNPFTPTPTATPTPTVTPTITPTVTPTPDNSPEVTPTLQKPVVKDETPKPTVTPIIRKPPVIKTQSRQTDKKGKILTDDCIYNGRCK